jgi:hypothetical protein
MERTIMQLRLAGFLLLFTIPLHAAIFGGGDFDPRKGGATLRVISPPERFLNGKTMRVKIGTCPKSFTRQTELLAAVEKSLSTQFVRVASGDADLQFEIDVVAYEPPNVREYQVEEKRKVQIGETPLYNKDGTPKKGLFGGQATQAIYEERMMPIGYWEGKGRLAIRITATPKGSSAAIDAATATAEFSEKRKTSDPAPQATLADMGRDFGKMLGFGQKTPEQSRQTPESLDLQFIEQVSTKTCRRFAKNVSEVAVVLSSEAALAGGTAMAMTGDWTSAIQAWDKASTKGDKGEWMRQYNLGIGHIALAFQAYDQGEDSSRAAGLFEKGGELLLKASALKPKEKHVTEALQHYSSVKTAMQNMANESVARADMEKRELAQIAAQREKVFRDTRQDSTKEASFRQLVVLRIKGAKGGGSLPADERSELEATGQKGYGLTLVQAQRVVFQENDRIATAAAAVDTYEATFASLVEDGELSAPERSVLQDLAKNLAISKTSADVIHKRYTFSEPAPQKAQSKPKSGKE